MVDISFLFGAVLFVDGIAIVVLLWLEHFTRYEGVVLWEEESPIGPLFWGSVIVLLAGVLSLIEFSVWDRPAIALNLGGAVAPLVVSGIIVLRRRPSALPLLSGILLTTIVSFSVVAFVGRPFYVPFPVGLVPSVIAAAVGVAFAGGRLISALDVAYVSASVGTIVGLDLVPLLASPVPPASSFVVGGGGILDLVFLGGVFAVALAWTAEMGLRLVRRERGRPAGADEIERAAGPRILLWQPRRKAATGDVRVDERPK